MKKRKNIILSAITCFVSICLLMLGVYSALNPSVSINGQVSYTARDASVLVQGKTSNDGTEITYSKTAPENKTALLALSKATDKINQAAIGDTPAEYFDWTQGEKSGNSSDTNETLSAWNIGTVSFKESSTGIKAIKVGFRFTNYSNYPVTATLTFDKTVKETSDANVTRTSEEQDKVITKELGIVGSANASATVEITFAVTDDSKGVNADGLLGMNIKFEKTATNAQASSYTLSSTERSTGKLTMGKQSSSSTAEDVQWKCFAYSTDGTTWTRLDSGASIPATAKYGYFVLDTYVSSLDNKAFLAEDKYSENSSDGKYYINAGENGVTTANTVYANDYYYSDIRQTLKGLETTLSISSDNEIYSAIQGRTITDLYGKMSSSSTDVSLPTGANASETDAFWLMSRNEANTYFANNAARKWMGDSGKWYWLRSPDSGISNIAYRVYDDVYVGNVDITYGARAAFKLQLA